MASPASPAHATLKELERQQDWLNKSWQNPNSQNKDYLVAWQKELDQKMLQYRNESAGGPKGVH